MIADLPLTLSLDYYDIEINDYIDLPHWHNNI